MGGIDHSGHEQCVSLRRGFFGFALYISMGIVIAVIGVAVNRFGSGATKLYGVAFVGLGVTFLVALLSGDRRILEICGDKLTLFGLPYIAHDREMTTHGSPVYVWKSGAIRAWIMIDGGQGSHSPPIALDTVSKRAMRRFVDDATSRGYPLVMG